jgi:hypothetical protein
LLKIDVCTHASLWLHRQAPQQLQPLFLNSIYLISFHSQVYEIWRFQKYKSFHICSTITMSNNPLGIHHTLSCFTQKINKCTLSWSPKWPMKQNGTCPQINNLHFGHIHELNKNTKTILETKVNFYHSSMIKIKYPPIYYIDNLIKWCQITSQVQKEVFSFLVFTLWLPK